MMLYFFIVALFLFLCIYKKNKNHNGNLLSLSQLYVKISFCLIDAFSYIWYVISFCSMFLFCKWHRSQTSWNIYLGLTNVYYNNLHVQIKLIAKHQLQKIQNIISTLLHISWFLSDLAFRVTVVWIFCLARFCKCCQNAKTEIMLVTCLASQRITSRQNYGTKNR